MIIFAAIIINHADKDGITVLCHTSKGTSDGIEIEIIKEALARVE